MTQTLTCLLICFLFPSASLTPSPSPRRNLGISNQVTASPPPVPSHVVLLKLSEINYPYLRGPCQPFTLPVTQPTMPHLSPEPADRKNINTDMKGF